MRFAVHQGRATVQGRSKMDSFEARRGDRCQPIPQGLPQDERGIDCCVGQCEWTRAKKIVDVQHGVSCLIPSSITTLMRLNIHNCRKLRSIQVFLRQNA